MRLLLGTRTLGKTSHTARFIIKPQASLAWWELSTYCPMRKERESREKNKSDGAALKKNRDRGGFPCTKEMPLQGR